MNVLTEKDVEAFGRDGFVRVEEAFPVDVALAFQEELWAELREEFGIEKEDRSTWRVPPRSPRRTKMSPLNESMAGPRFRGVIDDLLGVEGWEQPSTWGGFLVTFPTSREEPWDVPTELWHFDGPIAPAEEPPGLLIFSFYSEVGPQGGGTLLLRGSPRVVRSFAAGLTPEERDAGHTRHRKLFFESDPWLASLAGKGAPVEDRERQFMREDHDLAGVPARVIELTGKPGDAVFCHPWMVHAPAGRNHADVPRLMRGKFLW